MDAHPYIPNSSGSNQARMLQELGIQDIEELYSDIPTALRYGSDLDLPAALASESELRRHMSDLLAQNSPCGGRYLNFLGAGCYQHYVPAICDEINGRSEFLTAYSGQPYEDHGRWQALWEYTSLMGELLNLDVVNIPTYDACQAAATSVRMASRITGRKRVLVAANAHPDTLSHIRCYCRADLAIDHVPFDRKSGQLDSTALETMLSPDVAAVYFENPSYLGAIEAGQKIAESAHRHGALCITGVDPITLGVLAPPADFGADITCGDLQTLGIHMQFGNGHGGFIAVPDEQRFLMELPSRLYGIAPTSVEGEYGFGEVAFERTSLALREKGKEFVGTAASIWGITAGVFLALMGPSGMKELGESILYRSRYALRQLSQIPGVQAPVFDGPFFKEFVVRFGGHGRSVEEINDRLLERGIFGGRPLAREFPELSDCALFCFTEMHSKADIDRLAAVLTEVLK